MVFLLIIVLSKFQVAILNLINNYISLVSSNMGPRYRSNPNIIIWIQPLIFICEFLISFLVSYRDPHTDPID